MHWDGHAGTTEDYLYDASGERVMRRVVKTTGTQYFTYPFGLMDSTYTGSGVQALENDYYTLAGWLIGERESGVTVFLLTDELGSVLTSISAAAGSAAVINTQVYSPYGTPRYKQGTVTTSRGFTGQYRDGSGLDYYNARYYDPVVGRFVSADTVQGNAQGMDPYSYVGNNPETFNDPTGRCFPFCVVIPILAVAEEAIVGVAVATVAIITSPIVVAVLVAVVIVLAVAITYKAYNAWQASKSDGPSDYRSNPKHSKSGGSTDGQGRPVGAEPTNTQDPMGQ